MKEKHALDNLDGTNIEEELFGIVFIERDKYWQQLSDLTSQLFPADVTLPQVRHGARVGGRHRQERSGGQRSGSSHSSLVLVLRVRSVAGLKNVMIKHHNSPQHERWTLTTAAHWLILYQIDFNLYSPPSLIFN